jgi:hypothetical protein
MPLQLGWGRIGSKSKSDYLVVSHANNATAETSQAAVGNNVNARMTSLLFSDSIRLMDAELAPTPFIIEVVRGLC